MAQWNGTIFTKAGRALLSKVLAGMTTLNITRGVGGDGRLTAGQKLEDLTALISPRLNLPIASKKVNGDGSASIVININNTSLAALLEFREYGLYAQDPDVGEILYCVDNAGDYPDYVPAGGGPTLVNYNMNVVAVIGSVTNLEAKIDPNLTWASEVQVQEHFDSRNPHPNWLQVKDATTSPTHFWVQDSSDGQLHPVTLENARSAIMGNTSTIPVLSSRVNQLEIEQANIALKMVAEGDCPDSNLLLAEDFVVPDKIDTFAVQVKSVVAGDNGIDVQTLSGFILGAWYWITDGVNQEYIQVKSCIKNGSVYRILITSNIVNTYSIADTMIYRTTSEIDSSGVAYGAGDKKGFNWQPATVWQGVVSNVATTEHLQTTQANADAFTKSGDVAFTADGLFTLAAN